MKAANISENHHLVKYCKQRLLIRDEQGKPIRVHPAAFELRPPTGEIPAPEKTVSGVYYEFLDGDAQEKMAASVYFIDLTMKPKDALARMNHALIKEQGKKRSRKLHVRHEPHKVCPPYAALHGLPDPTDDELCALLASLSVVELLTAAFLQVLYPG